MRVKKGFELTVDSAQDWQRLLLVDVVLMCCTVYNDSHNLIPIFIGTLWNIGFLIITYK